jgi:hypothetical protein
LEKPLVSQIDPWFEFVWRVFLVEMTQWWLFFKAFFVTVMIWKVLCNVQNFKNMALNRWVVCSYVLLACWYDAEFGIEPKGVLCLYIVGTLIQYIWVNQLGRRKLSCWTSVGWSRGEIKGGFSLIFQARSFYFDPRKSWANR